MTRNPGLGHFKVFLGYAAGVPASRLLCRLHRARRSFEGLSAADREAAERHLNFARSLHIETRVLQGVDVTSTLVDFARRQHVTQIYMSRSALADKTFLKRNLVFQVLRQASDIQVTVVAERSKH